MVTPKVNTDLAKKKRLLKEVRSAQIAAPITFVISPIQELLDTVQAIAGSELRRLGEDLKDRPMSEGEARKLATLTDAAVKAHDAKTRVSDSDLETMSDEQLETAMLAELERIRSKRKGLGT